jgi:hypothetical protein
MTFELARVVGHNPGHAFFGVPNALNFDALANK